MEISDLKDKLIAIVGFGEKEGKATAEYLLRHGLNPVLFDRRPWLEWPEEQKNYIRSLGVQFIFGEDYLKELSGFDVVFRNPAIPRLTPELAALEKRGGIITSQTKWFFEHCPASIIGVTGTKGKGTTTSLIYQIIQEEFQNVHLTGNIGKVQPFEFLDQVTAGDWVVFELSSFQLQDLDRSPHIGVVLMVTSEHLDHHQTVGEYRTAKEAIVKFQTAGDYAIINADYEASKKIGTLGAGKKIFFSRKNKLESGCFVDENFIVTKGVGAPDFKFSISNLQLKGSHNLENVCAAILAARAAKISDESIGRALKNFKGLEHRLEFVAAHAGVAFYNDSFSTTPETAIAAIQSFSEPLILILGGSSKNSDFSGLVETVQKSGNIKAVIFVGPEGRRIRQLLEAAGALPALCFEGAQSMAEIVEQATGVAQAGDVVLLSPACASFGLFKNYKDRGEQFKETVKHSKFLRMDS